MHFRALFSGSLEHPNILTTTRNERALTALLGERGPLSEDEARRLARDLCAALSFLHARGVIHGGLSAKGVRVTGDRFLVDLGQSQRDRKNDERQDVLGVGEVLYEAITGKAPFVVPAESIPSAWRAPIIKCLQRDPSRRYGSIAELATSLGITLAAVSSWRRRALVLAVMASILGTALVLSVTPRPAVTQRILSEAATVRVETASMPRRTVGISEIASSGPELGRGISELLALSLVNAGALEPILVEDHVLGDQMDVLVSGTITAQAGTTWLEIEARETQSGALIFAERSKVSSSAPSPPNDEVLHAVQLLATRLGKALAIPSAIHDGLDTSGP